MSYEIINDEKVYSQAMYVQKYYEQLFINLLEEAYDNSLISHNELFVDYVKSRQDISSYYVMTLSIIAESEEDIYYDMTDVYYSSKVEYALENDLDDIGSIIGCPRPQATSAGVELTFSINKASDTTIPLDKGIIVSTTNGISYITVEDVSIPAGELSTTAFALSIEPGWNYRVPKESLTIIETELTDISGLKVINLESASGGSEAYDDEQYRTLIMEWIKNNTRGSKEAYNRYFATVDGLDSYKLIPNWDVSGTLKIVLDPGYPYQLQKCYEEITESVCQLPDDITMFSPERIGIDIYAKCNVDIDEVNPYSSAEKDSIKTRIIDAIKLFIDGDVYTYSGLKIGEDFIPYKLGVFISDLVPELKNITFLYPTEPITITDEEMGVSNDINIEME